MNRPRREWSGKALWIGGILIIAPFVALQFAPSHKTPVRLETRFGKVTLYGVDRLQIKSAGAPQFFALQIGRGVVHILFPDAGDINTGISGDEPTADSENRQAEK